jgi:CubicO group peptidase (beta-lactamase class C family)
LPEYRRAVAEGREPWSAEEMLVRVKVDRLRYRPGDGWEYSNVGYTLLRRIVEQTCGKDLEAALRMLVFEPLNLAGPRVAHTVEDMDRTIFTGAGSYHPGWVFHGLVIGAVVDAALALHGILEGELLSPGSRKAMLQSHPVGGAIEGRPWLTPSYGLGVMVGEMQEGTERSPLQAIGHSGGGPGSTGRFIGSRGPAIAARWRCSRPRRPKARPSAKLFGSLRRGISVRE